MVSAYMKITRGDKDIEIALEGTVCGAEPDVGIMSDWGEVESAKDPDGKEIELTESEMERASNALVSAGGYDPDFELDRRNDHD